MIPSANNFLVSGLRHQIYHSLLLFSFPAYYKQIRDTVTKKQDYLGIFPQIRDKVTKKRDYLGIIPTTLNIRGNPQPLSPQVPSKVRPGVFCIHTCFNAFAENLVSQDVKIDGMKGTEYIQP